MRKRRKESSRRLKAKRIKFNGGLRGSDEGRMHDNTTFNARDNGELMAPAPAQAPFRQASFSRRVVGWSMSAGMTARLVADSGIACSMSRSGNVWDNAAMESFFSSLKTERTAGKIYRTRNKARADVFDYIERFYNANRRHSTIGYLSPVEFERKVGLA